MFLWKEKNNIIIVVFVVAAAAAMIAPNYLTLPNQERFYILFLLY